MKKTIIPLGPFHPLLEEAEFYKLYVEGETVVDVDMRIGYTHRGIEKLSTSKTWDQVPFVVERICGICSTSHPMAYVLAVEDLGGFKVPARADYIRSIICELERIHSHLLWVGLAGHFIGYDTVFMWAWKYREPVLDICEKLTGNRNHYAMMKPGGVRRDLNREDFPWVHREMDKIKKSTEMLIGAVMDDPVLHARTKGVGVLTREDAIAYGTLGPTVRASGIPDDIRVDDPYAAYDRVDWKVITWDSCDVFAKAAVRLLEIIESIKIVKQCMDDMPDGPIDAHIKSIPAGEGVGHAEAPRGEVLHYVRGDGGNSPVRHKIRAPSFMNIPSFKATCVGYKIADVALITAAVDPCYCCTERMAVLERGTNTVIMSGRELEECSRKETERLRKDCGILSPVEQTAKKLLTEVNV
ncbi:MAG TPA: nickel-dependent hydrogenase large subunit [Anaerolineae bacterium]|nr:nickel-dependent hydrogenase large subunit [Anaerolineae bacterium]